MFITLITNNSSFDDYAFIANHRYFLCFQMEHLHSVTYLKRYLFCHFPKCETFVTADNGFLFVYMNMQTFNLAFFEKGKR